MWSFDLLFLWAETGPLVCQRSGLCFQLGLKSLCFYCNENLISGVLNPAVLGGDDAGPERGVG